MLAGVVRAQQTAPIDTGTYLVEVASGRMVRLGENALVAWSPDGKVAAVADKRGDPVEARLRLISVPPPQSGLNERVVELPEQGTVDMLRWSPDGSRLAAIFSRFGRDAGPALLVVDPATAKARELVHGSVGEIAWTPDSRFISAMTLGLGANDGAIVTFNAMNGDIETTVTSGPDASCQRGLAWSPDGKYLAYGGPGFHEGCGDVGNWGVWVWDKSTQTSKHLFRGGSDGPRWLENGNLVAMVSMPRSEGVPPLTLLRYESVGSEPSTLADSIPRMFPQPARMVQVAGNTVMYVVSTCDTAEAYLWTPGQAAPTRQTPAGVYAFEPTITPDGKQIAYVRVGDDQSELVVAPVGGGEARTVLRSDELGLQVGTQGPWGASGHWSPDGKWLAIEVTSEQEIDCVVLPGDRR